MSEAALALLDAEDTPKEAFQSPSKKAIALLEGKSRVIEPPPRTPSVAMAPVGALEQGTRAATRFLSGIPAGAAYAGAAIGKAFGMDVNPAQTMADVSDYFTYNPISESGKAAQADVDLTFDTLMSPIARQADAAATAVGKVSPVAETFLREAPAAAGAASGLVGLSPLASPAAQLVRQAPQAAATAARSTVAGAARAGKALGEGVDNLSDAATRAVGAEVRPKPNVVPESDPLSGFGADSASAASASRINTTKGISNELVQDLRAQIQKGPLDQSAVDRQIDADTLPIRMRLTEGQASQDVELASREFNAKGRDPDIAQRFNEQNQQLIDNLDEMRRQAAPQAVAHDPVQSGQNIVDAYKQMDEAAREPINAAYAAARALNGGELPMDGAGFVARADQGLKKAFKTRHLPAEIAGDLAEFRDGTPMNFEQWESLRTTLAQAERKASRAGDGNASFAIGVVRDALEATEPVGAAVPVKQAFDKARALAKERFDRIDADPAYKAAIDDDVPAGESSALADKFVEKYIVRGKRAHLEQMVRNLGGDDLAMETIRAAPFNYMKQRAGIDPYRNTGDFSQAGYNKALAELTPRLDLLVGEELAESAQQLGRVAYSVKYIPSGNFANRSHTFVAAAAEATKGLAERSANTLIGGNIVPVGTWAREKIDARTAARASKERMRPAAGTLAKEKKP